jgi:hypothetical protein
VSAGAAFAAEAASMLTELNREIVTPAAPPAEAKAAAPEPVAAAEADEAEREEPPAPMVQRDQADTAMLLRELSSLGFGQDDDRPAPPAHPPAQRPTAPVAPAADPKRKRKGLFGRG